MVFWWLSGCFWGCLKVCMLPPLCLCACPCLEDCWIPADFWMLVWLDDLGWLRGSQGAVVPTCAHLSLLGDGGKVVAWMLVVTG